jgi:diacylglycerol kinase (ATP)
MSDARRGTRNLDERCIVIANPRAGAGRAGAARVAIERAVGDAFAQAEVRWTEGPGHAEELARESAPHADIVAALGGDGTCHEVVNGLASITGERAGARGPASVPTSTGRRPAFGTIPFGTGGDLVRSLEVPGGLGRALWVLASGISLPVDLGKVTFAGGASRVFANVSGAGANAAVAGRANASSKRLGGFVTFLASTLQVATTYAPSRASWRWGGPDGAGEWSTNMLGAFIANGSWCGGGVRVAPPGALADGVLDLTVIPAMPLGRLLWNLRHLYDGHLAEVPGVLHRRVTWVEVDDAVSLEADGETGFGTGPARWEVLPRALVMRGGWISPPVRA